MNVIKFKFDQKEGYFSIVEYQDKYYTLAEKNTDKVIEAQNTNCLAIAYDVKNPVFRPVSVTVSSDPAMVETIYNLLKDAGNLYFDTLDETLCILEIPLAK